MRVLPWFLVGLAALVVSCGPGLEVVVSPEVKELLPDLQTALGSPVALEDPAKAERNTLRITTTPNRNLAPGSAPAGAFGRGEFPEGQVALPASLLALGAAGEAWSALPLLYDVAGQTVFVPDPKMPGAPQVTWAELTDPQRRVVVEGSRPALRQAAFALSQTSDALPVLASVWFARDPAPSQAALGAFGASTQRAPWVQDGWSWGPGDVANSYKLRATERFFETFRSYELSTAPGVRRFSPVVSANPGSYVVAGTVVFAEYRGTEPQAAADLVKRLLASDFVKQAGIRQKWLGASFQAPELDSDGAHVRQVVLGAKRFYPVTDRVTSPGEANDWVTAVQGAVDQAPRGRR
jgi:hypothetical protein